MEIINNSSGTIADGIYMAWEIKRIYIPQSIWEERDKILQAAKAALGVYRASYDEEDIKLLMYLIHGFNHGGEIIMFRPKLYCREKSLVNL